MRSPYRLLKRGFGEPHRAAAAHESGQSIIMISLILVVLIALVALVVDVGNAYAQRRVVQNAADAAALAGTRELARGSDTTNSQVLAEARKYAELNGIDPNTVEARYFSFNAGPPPVSTDLGVIPNTGTQPPSNADGVTISLGKTFNTFLAQVVGRSILDASADSMGQVSCGACLAGGGGYGLFPIVVDNRLFDNQRDNGKPALNTNYRIWGDKTSPGNFHWASWNQDGSHTSETTLLANMHDSSRSGEWSVGSEVPCGTGVMNSSEVKAELDVRIANTDPNRPQKVLLPIYDRVSGTGSSVTYRVSGFAWFKITGYNFSGSNKYVEGQFVAGGVPDSEGGCPDYGACSVDQRIPIDLRRSISGHIAYQRLVIQQPNGQTTYPVDVVNVIDTSGSMNDTWGSGEAKIVTARRVLTEFNNRLRPDIGDKVGLVHFPRVNSLNGSSGYETFSGNYRTSCGSTRTNYRFRGRILSDLTTDIASVNSIIGSLGANGGTPIADAMLAGFEVMSGLNHVAGHAKIVILASDGMTNVTSDDRWTGYVGSTTTGMGGCNGQAETQATSASSEAKSAGVQVFTIAIGDDFSGSLLQAMSSPDADPSKPHYFQASNPTAMQQVYDSLGERIVNYGGECTITPVETGAAGAYVSVYRNGALYATKNADNGGNFTFVDVPAGTYTFAVSTTVDGLTYDVFTTGVGGDEISSPALAVGESEGTYSIELSLKTNASPSCGGL